jgi:hypothetical protein
VAKRVRGKLGTEHNELCHWAAPPTLMSVPETPQEQFYRPALQFAKTICRGLDLVQEEGLLLAAKDTCKFYQHRDWSRGAAIVNEETTFAHLVGGLIDASIPAARKGGVAIEDLSAPAARNYNLLRIDGDRKDKGKKG